MTVNESVGADDWLVLGTSPLSVVVHSDRATLLCLTPSYLDKRLSLQVSLAAHLYQVSCYTHFVLFSAPPQSLTLFTHIHTDVGIAFDTSLARIRIVVDRNKTRSRYNRTRSLCFFFFFLKKKLIINCFDFSGNKRKMDYHHACHWH